MNTERPPMKEPTMPASTPKPRWTESKDRARVDSIVQELMGRKGADS